MSIPPLKGSKPSKKKTEKKPVPPPERRSDEPAWVPPPPGTSFDFSHLAADDHTVEEARIANRMQDLIKEVVERKSESIKLYEPLPSQVIFHKSKCKVRCIRGGNRGGKTLAAVVELVRAALGRDPHDKYPKTVDIYVVGKDWLHIGETIYPKLFQKGAFKIIRDKTTGLMRAYRPWDEADRKRSSQSRMADPLIPKRYIQEIAWEDKRRKIPSLVRLKNGSRFLFFSGKAEPPQGMQIDIGLLDEEVPRREWFTEFSARTVDREGVIIWSATPQIGTEQFYELCTRAQEQIYLPEEAREVEEHFISLGDNLHITEKAKSQFLSTLSEHERDIRGEGQFASAGRIIYPEYSKGMHCIEHFPIPANWTFYATIDPGRQVCAVLFSAVPDPRDMVDVEDPYDLLLFDELYIPRCTAKLFGFNMKQKCAGRNFEDFVIDMHGARVADMGSGITVYEQYRDALADNNVRCHRRKNGFGVGDDDVRGCVEKFRAYLVASPYSGRPRVRMMATKDERGQFVPLLPNFHKEIMNWKYKVVRLPGGEIIATDDPEDRGPVHLMACARYLAGMKPGWVTPPVGVRPQTHPLERILKLRREIANQNRTVPTNTTFGPAGSY